MREKQKINHAKNRLMQSFGLQMTRLHTTAYREFLTQKWTKASRGEGHLFPRYHVATADWDGHEFQLNALEFRPSFQLPEDYHVFPSDLQSNRSLQQFQTPINCANAQSVTHVRMRLQQWSREMASRGLEVCYGEYRLDSELVDNDKESNDNNGPGGGAFEAVKGWMGGTRPVFG